MKLTTRLRHCLYLNWALPASCLPPAPDGLHYQTHSHDGASFGFVTALVVGRQSLQLDQDSRLRMSFPQLTLRLYVLDDEGVPAVLMRRILMPVWVLPVLRPWLGPSLASARFDISGPSPSGDSAWRVQSSGERSGELRCRTEPASPTLAAGPVLGSWKQAVEYLSHRERGYVCIGNSVRRIQARQPDCEAIPVDTALDRTDLLEQSFGNEPWPPLYCSFMFPELSFVLDTQQIRAPALGRQATVPG